MTVLALDLQEILQRIESRDARIGIIGMGYVGDCIFPPFGICH
jgi:hypothetical protein